MEDASGPRATKRRRLDNPRSLEAIAERLEATRKALGLNQAQFCRRSGIATNTYNQWKKAKGRPSLDEVVKLVDTLGVTLDWVYLGSAGALPRDLAEKINEQMLLPARPPKSTHLQETR